LRRSSEPQEPPLLYFDAGPYRLAIIIIIVIIIIIIQEFVTPTSAHS